MDNHDNHRRCINIFLISFSVPRHKSTAPGLRKANDAPGLKKVRRQFTSLQRYLQRSQALFFFSVVQSHLHLLQSHFQPRLSVSAQSPRCPSTGYYGCALCGSCECDRTVRVVYVVNEQARHFLNTHASPPGQMPEAFQQRRTWGRMTPGICNWSRKQVSFIFKNTQSERNATRKELLQAGEVSFSNSFFPSFALIN